MPPSYSPTPSTLFPTPALADLPLRYSYAIARGEQGVLTFEPYKGILLPHWRFRTLPIAQESCKTLESAFEHYVDQGDFVGADMARKFVQMGMTRSKRYANHASGRKYAQSSLDLERSGQKGAQRTELPKSTDHKGREEKLAASEVFKEAWRRCIENHGYMELKGAWQKEKKEWVAKGGDLKEVKKEDREVEKSTKRRMKIKKESESEDEE